MKINPRYEEIKKICEEFPSSSTRQLTRIITKKYPEITYNSADSLIRRLRGVQQMSKKNGKVQKVAYNKPENAEGFYSALPKPEPSKFKIEELPIDVKKWLILSDIHVPYHDLDALTVAIEYGKKEKVDGVLLLGDIVDFYQLSTFSKDPLMRRPIEELNDTKKVLGYIRKQLNPKRFLYKAGNHEQRLEWFLMKRAPELFDLPCITLPELLDFDNYGVQHIPALNVLRRGHLTLIHGHETGRGLMSPVNPARGMYMKAKGCVLSGHEHRTSDHTENTIMDEVITCWSIGCLCERKPAYRPINNWNHGFAILHGGHDWSIDNKKIVNGKVL